MSHAPTSPRPVDPAVPSAERSGRETDLQRRLDELLERRDDLAGVSGMADLLRQAVRWSA